MPVLDSSLFPRVGFGRVPWVSQLLPPILPYLQALQPMSSSCMGQVSKHGMHAYTVHAHSHASLHACRLEVLLPRLPVLVFFMLAG